MGTLARITARGGSDRAADAAVQLAFARLRELDQRLSDYLPESELNRAVRQAVQRPVALSADLATVIAYAQRLAAESAGAFDITAAPLTHLWRQARRLGQLPVPEALAQARALCGYQKLTLADGALSLALPGMQLDLGGLAKGYAADQALRVLRGHGVSHALVALSGDIAVAGRWTVALQHFGQTVERVRLHNQAVSTSGDTEQFVEIAGRRYSHILDPRTGFGLTGAPAVSVIARSGLEADALSTAVVIAGRRLLAAHPHTRAVVTARPQSPASTAGTPARPE